MAIVTIHVDTVVVGKGMAVLAMLVFKQLQMRKKCQYLLIYKDMFE